ncbi:MAG: sialate O-acetylesterase [Prevotellaceae bacterium]|jgi:sialate O-acetylesterase|nr:sialate O-acetylesterase [Prevotellaceae bacterium]
MKKIYLFLMAAAGAATAAAEVKLPYIFGSNMVLQQHSEVALWGEARAGATLVLETSWNGRRYAVEVGSDGRWRQKVSTAGAGGPYEVTLNDGAPLTLANVMLGEVWLCSGQSNMEMPVKGYRNQPTTDANRYILHSRNKNIRCITAPRASTVAPQGNFSREALWQEASPASTGSFSATAYHFGKLLNDLLDVPVGLVCVSYGGATVEAWMSKEALADFPDVKIPKSADDIKPVNRTPTTLYNAMLNPVVGYGIRGCIWYQGESNYEAPDRYALLLPAMVRSWRRAWGADEFPFYYAQIAPFDYASLPPYRKGGKYNSAFLRDAQRKCESAIPNAAMAVLIDRGEERCIHPADKHVAGERLALQALARTYGLAGFAFASPSYKEMKVSGDTVTVYFDNAPMGLTSYGRELALFEVAGANRTFYPAKATINSGKYASVMLACPQVKEPVAVRYAFGDFVVGDLFGTEGLPVSSFRTDSWDE